MLGGRYELEQVLGGGGMGQVWSARDLLLQERVGVKVMLTELLATDDGVQRFLREGRVARVLTHPHIIKTMNIEVDGDIPYIVMEMLEGRTLRDWMDSHPGPAPRQFVQAVGRQLLAAIGYAHEHDVVHRDLKPQNIFVCETRGSEPFVKVLDFGLAKFLQRQDSGVTQVIGVAGSPAYMSPEQMTGREAVDERTDLFSLAVVLHELLTGELPHGHVAASVPASLRPVFEKAMRPRVRERYAKASEMLAAWEAAGRSLLPAAPTRQVVAVPSSSTTRPVRTRPNVPTPQGRRATDRQPRTGARVLLFGSLILGLGLVGWLLAWSNIIPASYLAWVPPEVRQALRIPEVEAQPTPEMLAEEARRQENTARARTLLGSGRAALQQDDLEGAQRAMTEGQPLDASLDWAALEKDIAARKQALSQLASATAASGLEGPGATSEAAEAEQLAVRQQEALAMEKEMVDALERLDLVAAREVVTRANAIESDEARFQLGRYTQQLEDLQRLLEGLQADTPVELARSIDNMRHEPYREKARQRISQLQRAVVLEADAKNFLRANRAVEAADAIREGKRLTPTYEIWAILEDKVAALPQKGVQQPRVVAADTHPVQTASDLEKRLKQADANHDLTKLVQLEDEVKRSGRQDLLETHGAMKEDAKDKENARVAIGSGREDQLQSYVKSIQGRQPRSWHAEARTALAQRLAAKVSEKIPRLNATTSQGVRDGLRRWIDQGQELDPNAADWTELRKRITASEGG